MAKKDRGDKKDKKDRKEPAEPGLFDLSSAIAQAARTFRTVQSHNLASSGLYAGQDGVILLLYANDGLTAGAIAQALGVKPPTMTRTIVRMEAQGFVQRREDEGDGRLTKVFLTPLGRNTIARIQAATMATQSLATANFSDKQLRTLMKLLNRLSANLRGEPEAASAEDE